jgi:hypothetical protein
LVAETRWRAASTGACPALRRVAVAALVICSLGLAGCDKLGLGSASQDQRREAEGRAIGGGCRHAGRAIEDCFALNRQADKAAVFAGWREMNDYMRKHSAAPAAAAASSAGN